MEIKYWISPHEHPLRLRDDLINDDEVQRVICQICNSHSTSDAPFYACDSCSGYYVHKSCAKLPDKIQHPFHPHSLLTFNPENSTLCDICYRFFEDSPFYSCDPCNFDMDPDCALMHLGRDWIRHFGHPHPLMRVDDDQHIKCFGCKSTSRDSDRVLYGCSSCKYFLDKSCAKLPPLIHHPLHHNHRGGLVLDVVEGNFNCSRCRRIFKEDRFNFRFSCNQCDFNERCFKCAEVASVMSESNIKYEDHDHLLQLMENVEEATLLSPCSIGYDSYCTQRVVRDSDEFRQPKSWTLWCLYCNYRVHLLCGRLPSVIKHQFHIHSLNLVDSMREDDSGEYYCDVCEKKRDPQIRLYCCQDCKYFAHIHCVISEILKILNGDIKDVELKTVGQDIWNMFGRDLTIDHVDQVLTLKNVINSKLSEDEKAKLRRFYKWDETSSVDQKGKEEDRFNEIESRNSFKVGDDEIDEIIQLSRFTDTSFRSFCSNLRDFFKNNELELKSSDLALKIVMVKDYMIPQSLAAVLNTLLYEFGDIGSGSSYSQGFKSFVLFVICKTMKRMYSTMANCITKSLLQEWYYHLNFARGRGFKVDFACVQLEQLVHAFLGFQAERLEEEIPTILTKKIVELHRKMDKCKEYRGSSPKSEYMKYCLNKASEFRQNDPLGDSLTRKRTQFGSQLQSDMWWTD